jgi:hypothetical protein
MRILTAGMSVGCHQQHQGCREQDAPYEDVGLRRRRNDAEIRRQRRHEGAEDEKRNGRYGVDV